MAGPYRLAFEKEIYELEEQLARLEAAAGEGTVTEEIRDVRRALVNLKRKIYSNLSAWNTVQVARHPERITHAKVIIDHELPEDELDEFAASRQRHGLRHLDRSGDVGSADFFVGERDD